MNHALDGPAIGGLMLCVFVVIAILEFTKRARLNKKAVLTQQLLTATEKHLLTVTRWDVFGDHILGYDQANNTLFFYSVNQNEVLLFDINNIADCTLQKSINGSALNTIDLFLRGLPGKTNYTLPLYSRLNSSLFQTKTVNYNAEKWKTLIEDAIIANKLSVIRAGR